MDVKLYHDKKTAKKDIYWVIEVIAYLYIALSKSKTYS